MTLNRDNYPGVPEDFPIEAVTSGLAGAQLKLNLVQEGGKYYASGTSPSEVLDDYLEMRDLVPQVLDYCTGDLATKKMSIDAVLEQETQNLVQHCGFRAIHVAWLIARVREQLVRASKSQPDDATGNGA